MTQDKPNQYRVTMSTIPQIRTQVVAKYHGEVIGYFDNADDAQAAIDAQEAKEAESDMERDRR